MTMVPRTGPFSASSALATTSWYHRGKSVAWGVRMGAFAMAGDVTAGELAAQNRQNAGFVPPVRGGEASEAGRAPGDLGGAEDAVSPPERTRLHLGDPTGPGERG